MQYQTLGQSDLKVSRIALGTMTFGRQNTEAEAFEQLDYALAQGGISMTHPWMARPWPKHCGCWEIWCRRARSATSASPMKLPGAP